jgi:hypothetical protein
MKDIGDPENRKPGAKISTRTRSKVGLIPDEDGVFPKPSTQRYDYNGELRLEVVEVLASRASSDDIFGVDFKVSVADPANYHWVPNPNAGPGHQIIKGVDAWENVSVLNSGLVRRQIAWFYQKDPGAYGMEMVEKI